MGQSFKGTDVEMLMVCAIIVKNAKVFEATLAALRSGWKPPYLDGLGAKIDTTLKDVKAVDKAAPLREATEDVALKMELAKKDLGFFKLQFEEDFKDKKDFVKVTLTTLGFASHWEKAYHGNQQSMIQLLLQFDKNMTPDLEGKVVVKGIDTALIGRVRTYGMPLKDANTVQETEKLNKVSNSNTGREQLLAVYNETMSLAKIARVALKGVTTPDKFTYSKILDNLSSGSNGGSNGSTPEE